MFLADITSKPVSGSPSVGIHEELGIGYTMRDRLDNTFKSFPLAMGEKLEAKKDAAENKRLLYVGCTRAVDRLIISGGSPSKHPTRTSRIKTG